MASQCQYKRPRINTTTACNYDVDIFQRTHHINVLLDIVKKELSATQLSRWFEGSEFSFSELI